MWPPRMSERTSACIPRLSPWLPIPERRLSGWPPLPSTVSSSRRPPACPVRQLAFTASSAVLPTKRNSPPPAEQPRRPMALPCSWFSLDREFETADADDMATSSSGASRCALVREFAPWSNNSSLPRHATSPVCLHPAPCYLASRYPCNLPLLKDSVGDGCINCLYFGCFSLFLMSFAAAFLLWNRNLLSNAETRALM
jgi:hypothetical protein